MLSRLLSWLRRTPTAPLKRTEMELITALRASPETPLQGTDLGAAESLTGRGYLRRSGSRRFVLTEKGVVAYRSSRFR